MTDTVAYLRVSTEEQARADRTSMVQQRDGCAQLADRLLRAIGRTFEDPGASGGTADRPGFQALIAFCRANPRRRSAPGLILCYNHSRWGRFPDPDDATWWRQEMKHVGWFLRFAEGGGHEDSTISPILNAVQDTQATAYREAIRATAVRGWKGAAAKGYWQNEAPYGYRRMATGPDGKTRVLEPGRQKSQDERVKLTPGPAAEVAMVRWIFRKYATGDLSLHALSEAAHTRAPAKRWSAQLVGAIIKNPAYAGDVVWGRRPNIEGGKQSPPVDRSLCVVTENAHPALVSRELFERAQARRAGNRGQTRLTTAAYPLSGLITCAHCTDHYVGGGGPKGPPGDPERYRFYRHSTMDARPGLRPEDECPALHSILPKRIAEPAVLDAMSELIASPYMAQVLARVIDRRMAQLSGAPEASARSREKQRARLVAERDRLVTLAGQGVMLKEEVAPRFAAIRSELAQLDEQSEKARFQSRRLSSIETAKRELLDRMANFGKAMRQATGPALRSLIRPWIHAIKTDRLSNTLRIELSPLPAGAGLFDSTHWPGRG